MMPSDMEHQLRASMREQLRQIAPPRHVDEIVDLAFHAAKTAIEACHTVVERASDEKIMIAALGPALGILAAVAQIRVEGLRTFAEQNGFGATEFRMIAEPGK